MIFEAQTEPVRDSSSVEPFSVRWQKSCDAPAADPNTKKLEAYVAKFEEDLGAEIREFMAANPDHVGCRLVRLLSLSTALEERKFLLFLRDNFNLNDADSSVAQLHRKLQVAIDEKIASVDRHCFSMGKPKGIKGEEILFCLLKEGRTLAKTVSELLKVDRLTALVEERFGTLLEKRPGRRTAW
jgi:hypothetical protein